MRPRPNQIVIFLLSFAIGFSLVGGVFVFPHLARAQWVVTDPGQTSVNLAKWTWERLTDAFKVIKKNFADVAFKNALKTYLTAVAEDAATWVASAGTGQKALFTTDPQYFKKLNDAAAGDFIDSLSTPAEIGGKKCQAKNGSFTAKRCSKNDDCDTAAGEQCAATKTIGSTFGKSLCDPGATKIRIDLALRQQINPNFCQEGCQKNYNTGQTALTVSVSKAAGELTMTIADAERKLASAKQDKTEGLGRSPFCVDTATIDECITSFSTAITNGKQKLQDDLKFCLSLCTAGRRQSRCTLSQIDANLDSAEVAVQYPKIFDPKANDIGQFLYLYGESIKAGQVNEQEGRDLLGNRLGAIGPLLTKITKETKTPSDVTSESAKENLAKDQSKSVFGIYTGSPIADAIGVFTNTLTRKLLDRIYKCGLNPDTCFEGGGGTQLGSPGLGGFAGGYNSTGIAAARASFATSFTPDLASNTEIDILTDLQSEKLLDPGLRDAISAGMTVREATETSPPKLDRNKPFGFSKPAGSPAQSVEPDVGSGYSYRSLLYLRKYRIIPVTWEIAARYIGENLTAPVTFGKVLDCYNDAVSEDCKPFYRLVDPNWVLKVPAFQCARKGFTDEIVPGSCHSEPLPPQVGVKQEPDAVVQASVQVCQREEGCVDERSCVVETPDGKGCREYGYCTAEKPIWRFSGTACSAQYEGCQSYVTDAGQTVTYDKDTITANNCTSGVVGCQRYCRPGYCVGGAIPGASCTENADCRGGGTCQTAYDPSNATWKNTCTVASTLDKIQLDKDAEQCSPSSEGCSTFLRTTGGANLVRNPSFEQHSPVEAAGGRENFDGWSVGGSNQTCGAQAFADEGALFGQSAMRLQQLPSCGAMDSAQYTYQYIETGTLIANRTFTISYSGRSIGAACGSAFNIDPGGTNLDYIGKNVNYSEDWQRYSLTATIPERLVSGALVTNTGMIIQIRTSPTCNIVLDGVQVEESAQPSAFRDYGAGNSVTLKETPPYLTCTGNLATDPAECANYALKCSAKEVGCERFTPLGGAGSDPIPATVTNPLSNECVSTNYQSPSCSQCLAQFVGCKPFQEVALANNPPDPLNAVRTGLRCSNDNSRSCRNDGDCSAGGLCLPSLSIIPASGRQCTAADVGCEEYTNLDVVAKGGEGKEYYKQVKQCVNPNDPDLRNFYSWEGSNISGFQLKLHRLKKSDVDSGPCTNLRVTGSINAACEDSARGLAANYSQCTAADLQTNPDCIQFYDESGSTYLRLLSRTITGSDSCIPYRNTLDNNVYYFDGTKSVACGAAAAGCREYKGNAGNNVRVVVNDTFEEGTNAGWTGGTNSTESVTFGGRSLEVNGPSIRKDVTGILQGKAYLVSFWAKGQGTLSVGLLTNPLPTVFTNATVPLTAEWRPYTFGPVTITNTAPSPTPFFIGGITGQSFFDNITLTEVADSVYLVRNTYQFCQGYENCSAYQDRAGNTHFLKSFEKLCPSEKVGCEALLATQNSSSPFEQTFRKNPDRGDANADGRLDDADLEFISNFLFKGGPAPEPFALGDVNGSGTINSADGIYLNNFIRGIGPAPAPYEDSLLTVPADRMTYLVNDPAKSCAASEEGCKRFGVPRVDADNSVTGYETMFRKDDPDAYGTILCQGDQVGCSAFTLADTNGQAFFKDPGQRLCEYRENVGPTKKTGWFKTGTDVDCPSAGWTHQCPADQSSCSLYTAPTDYPTPAGGETNYTYLATSVSASDCPQGLDPKVGCLAFHVDSEASGNNTIRPNLNRQDNTVISQSCQLCNPDPATCGRYAGAPCCAWDPASCTTTKADGADGIRPLYCLYENNVGNAGCDPAVVATTKVVRDHPTAPTNCGAAGQPGCFAADLSDYDPAVRLCSDFACSANTILKVTRDRMCGEWLKCTDEQVVTNNEGKQTSVCLNRQLCRADPGGGGTCTFVSDVEFPRTVPPTNQVVQSPGTTADNIDLIANASGYNRPGVKYPDGKVVPGYLPYDQMSEAGIEGSEIDVPNGDFEAPFLTGAPTIVAENDPSFEWKADGATIKLEKVTPQTNFSNQTLRVISKATTENGGFVPIGKDFFSESAAAYIASFSARTDSVVGKTMKIFLRQKQSGVNEILFGPVTIQVSTVFSRYVISLLNVPGKEVLYTGSAGEVELVFVHPPNNLPNESFSIDDVSLKPVLTVQDDGAGAQTYVARQCRSYPKDVAPLCEFTDSLSGVNFRGWRGYCVERDPADPAKCLNWWPVDVISGEANVFGEGEQSLTRSPLYYCAEGTPKQLPEDVFSASDTRTICVYDWSGCALVAYVSEPRAKFFSLLGTNSYLLGEEGKMIDAKIHSVSSGDDDSRGSCYQKPGNLSSPPQTNATGAMQLVLQYYNKATFYFWKDLGGASGGDWEDCNNTDDDAYDSDTRVVVDINPALDREYWPRQCNTLVRLSKSNGSSRPWATKVAEGGYNGLNTDSYRGNHPLYYQDETACSPYGGLPVFQTPAEAFTCVSLGGAVCDANCVRDPNSVPGSICSKQRVDLYHPYNTSNDDRTRLCTQTNLGNGFYSCKDGLCRTCSYGPDAGLNCVQDSDCRGSSVNYCVGGSNPGAACTKTNTCAGATGFCDGSPFLGSACTSNDDCGGSICVRKDGKCTDGVTVCATRRDCPFFEQCNSPSPTACSVTTSGCAGSGSCEGICSAQPICTPSIGLPLNSRACNSNSDCPASSTCQVPSFRYETIGSMAQQYPGNTSGIARLKQMFVESYGFWTWDATQKAYVPNATLSDWAPPTTECTGGVRPTAGVTTGFEYRARDAYCYIQPLVLDVKIVATDTSGSEKTFTSGTVSLRGSNRTVTLQWIPKPDTEQKPIRSTTIDWGDSAAKSGYTGSAATKTYWCPTSDGVNCSSCPGSGTPSAGACQYTPTIRIRDNWGKESADTAYQGIVEVRP